MNYASYEKVLSTGHHVLYSLAVFIAGVAGGILIIRDSKIWPLTKKDKISIFISVVSGCLIGCAIPAFIAGDFVEWQAKHYLIGPKTIIGGILSGFLFVAIYKKLAGITYDTSDAFIRGTALMMAIGRLGCVA